MPIYAQWMKTGFKLPQCEKHFHDHDEIWLIQEGQGTGYYIDFQGKRSEFTLHAGDVWMIPTGYEHGSNGPNSEDFTINVFNGTLPAGAHKPGHYYVEEQGYLPQLELRKVATQRYRSRPELPASMRGIVFEAQGVVRFKKDIPVPPFGDDQILIRTQYSGLTNGTERNLLVGGNYGGNYPVSFGYQNVGEVVAIGDKATTSLRIGDRVFSGNFQGHLEYFTVRGSYADDDSQNWVVKLPDRVKSKDAALFGMASVAMNNVRRSKAGLGSRVLVVGLGPIGQFTAQAARAAGAYVVTCDLVESRLELSRQLDADEAINTSTDEGWAQLRAAGPFDIIFEDSGAPILDRVIGKDWTGGLLKTSGLLVMVAGRNEVNYVFNAGQASLLNIMHVGHFERADLLAVTRLTDKGIIQVDSIIQDTVHIEDSEDVYARLLVRNQELMGVVYEWEWN